MTNGTEPAIYLMHHTYPAGAYYLEDDFLMVAPINARGYPEWESATEVEFHMIDEDIAERATKIKASLQALVA